MLVNLAGNAVKFTDAGGVGLTLDPGGPGEIVLSVADTGPGVPLDRVPASFAEFEQGDGSPSRRHGGTGLGLAITRRVVERMGGAIEVDSAVGAGSTFGVRVPLPEARDGPAPVEAEPSVAGQRFVVLARSPFEAPFLARRLRNAGAATVLAETGPDALAAVAADGCDALLVDCALGPDVTRAVALEARLAGAKPCFVLLSPFDRRPFGSPGAAGFDGYLVKPVRPRSLLALLAGRPARPIEMPSAEAPHRAGTRGATARVLLAEDNEINALLAMRSLEKLGAAVDWAKTAAKLWLLPRLPSLASAHLSISSSWTPACRASTASRRPGGFGRPNARPAALRSGSWRSPRTPCRTTRPRRGRPVPTGSSPSPSPSRPCALLDGLHPPLRVAS